MIYPNVSDSVTVPSGIPDRTLFVSVDKTYQKPDFAHVSLEDCARGYWTVANLKASHADECEYLMARRKGKIVGAWKIDAKGIKWKDVSLTPKKTWPEDKGAPNRKGCLVVPDKSLERFIGQEVHLGRCPCSRRSYFAK